MALPKNKTIINIDDYTGFRWNGKHTSQLGLTIVSSSSRYSLNPISSITNNTVDVPGGDGQYFFNATYGPKKWTINFAFDNLDDYQWRDLLNWLYHKDTSDLVFDELPYKAYNAKLEGTPSVNYLCFTEARAKYDDPDLDEDTLEPFDWTSYDNAAPALPSYITHEGDGNNFDTMYYKKRIYRGEGTINFVAFFPYAYSARDYNGKYMKYLDEIEYFPNYSEQTNISVDISNTGSIFSNEKAVYQLKRINGVTNINSETGLVERAIIGESQETQMTIFAKDKTWTYFRINGEDKENENEYKFLDTCDDVSDSIEFVEGEQKGSGKYQLIKRVGVVDLFTNEDFILALDDYIEFNKDSEEPVLTFDFNLNKIENVLSDILLTDDDFKNPQGLKLNSNQFKITVPTPENEESTSKTEENTIQVATITQKQDKTVKNIVLTFTFSSLDSMQKLREKANQKATDDIVQNTINQCLLFYPKQEEQINITENTNTTSPLELKIPSNEGVVLGIRNKAATEKNTNLMFRVEFTQIPVLYDNFDEWKDSSGLKETKYTDPEYFDDCIKIDNKDVTFGYKVYNGGDIPTPFRLTYPVPETPLEFNKKEITFVLAQKKDNFSQVDVNRTKEINNIMELQMAMPYSINNSDYIYYFYKITDYQNNKAEFLNVSSGDFEEFEVKGIYQRVLPEENLKAIDSFTIRFYNEDSENSYAEIVQNYTIAAAQNNANQYFTNKLEIDTYKQTINFVSINKNGKETIIPIYFTLRRGNLFYIPPKVDNLYVLVYNKRDNRNSFINNKIKANPEIEYRYLYL